MVSDVLSEAIMSPLAFGNFVVTTAKSLGLLDFPLYTDEQWQDLQFANTLMMCYANARRK